MERKKILFKNNEIKELTIEETIKQFEPYIYKNSTSFFYSFKNQYPKSVIANDLDDIKSCIYMGILKAYNSYDISKNILFMTYMIRIINNEVLMFLRTSKANKEYGKASLDDIITTDKNGNDLSYKDILVDERVDLEYSNLDNKEILLDCLSVLKKREKEILFKKYFLNKTQSELAKEYNFSQSYIARILKKCIKKMKERYTLRMQCSNKKLIKLSQTEKKEVSVEYLLDKYKPFLISLSKKYYQIALKYKNENHDSYFIEFEDFYQLACIGLYKSFNNYDIKKDILFYSYMLLMCEGELKKYIRDSLHLRRKEEKDNGLVYIKSIYTPVTNNDREDKDILLVNKIEDKNNNYNDIENKMLVKEYLNILSEKEKNIIYDYYYKEMPQMKMKDKYNISQAQISRILKTSIKKIKKYIEEGDNMNNLNRYIDEFFLYAKDCTDNTLIIALKNFCNKNGQLKTTDLLNEIKKIPGKFEELKYIFETKKESENILEEPKTEIIENTEKNIEEPIKDITEEIEKDTIKDDSIINIKQNNDSSFNLPKGVQLKGITVDIGNLSAEVSKDIVKFDENFDISSKSITKEALINLNDLFNKILQIMEVL